MTTILGRAEIKQEFINVMGQEVGELFADLWDEVTSLHLYWSEFVELYARGEDRVHLLNQSASCFFWIVEKILWEHILIQITRILDAPKRSQQKRATLKTLRDALSAELKHKVTNRLEMISQHAAFCWDWRNRYVAHRDHALVLEKITNALLLGSPGDVEKILEGMAELLNLIREHYGMHPVAFDAPSPHQGVQKLLRTLQLGLMMKERRNAQMDRGEEPDGGFALPLV